MQDVAATANAGVPKRAGDLPDKKIAHLNMIQDVVDRLSSNSFQLKGWSIAIVTALFALSAKDARPILVYLAYFPTTVFWFLDGYFLSLERRYRTLFDHVRSVEDTSIDFAMNIDRPSPGTPTWFGAAFSATLLVFHGSVIVAVSVAAFLLRRM